MAAVQGQSGVGMLDRVRYIVELAVYLPHRVDWMRDGEPTAAAKDANEHARSLRSQGYRVRVRPVVIERY